MNFDGDAFISYAHLDNAELIEGHKGWVANLHRALEIRVGQLLGKAPHIWRDPKLQGNDFFADTLVERLRRVAVLVSVVSPRYVKSEWARKELTEFWKAAELQGGVHVANKARIFKVLKTPVSLELQSPELRSLLGYEFFKVDPETGRVRELDEVFGPEAQREFWIKLDDLAHEMCGLLEILEAPGGDAPVPEPAGTVFLAETTGDVREQREAIRRDLIQHGYTVLPAAPLPLVASDAEPAIRQDLSHCRMSIHLIGRNYGLVPEGAKTSLVEIQNELAIERAQAGRFSRLLWIPHGLQVDDERQQRVIEHLRMDPRSQKGADLLETYLEDLRTVIHDTLAQSEEPKANAVPRQTAAAGGAAARLYLIYDQRDANVVSPWADFLFDQHLEVIHPVFEGHEAEIREYHEETLCLCDGVLIFFGAANETWLRRKLREIQKSAGYGRTKPAPAVAICAIEPKTPEKERFRTHEATVVLQWGGFSADAWPPFVSRLKGAEGQPG
jgi:hypothetical protein